MTEEQASSDFRVRFSDGARFLVLLVGSLYTLGLLIVNVDLNLYGIAYVDFARPEYVLAGALWAVVVLAPALGAARGIFNAKDFARHGNRQGFGPHWLGY